MATLKAKYGTEEEVNLGATTGIAAVIGDQTTATQLTKKWNEITSSGDGFGVKLSSMKIGSKQGVFNNTVNPITVYPTIGESINGIVNYAFVVAAGGYVWFESPKNGLCFSSNNSL